VLIAKVAVTVVFAFNVNEHVPVPAHPPPDHPVNVEPVAGDAVRVTMVLWVYAAAQLVPQLIPEGELVTVPEPLPSLLVVRVYC
jgi:hypothetical protein